MKIHSHCSQTQIAILIRRRKPLTKAPFYGFWFARDIVVACHRNQKPSLAMPSIKDIYSYATKELDMLIIIFFQINAFRIHQHGGGTAVAVSD